jgi:signal transduction histidine kinase
MLVLVALMVGVVGCGSQTTGGAETLAWNKKIASAVTHSAALGLGGTLKGVADPQQKIAMIREYIEPVRFYDDDSGYFYVYDSSCTNVAHATQKNLVGTSLYDYKDTKGTFVIRELLAAARTGGGFVEYYWIKPGEQGEKAKLGYVEPIPGTDYFIGTGVYLEE